VFNTRLKHRATLACRNHTPHASGCILARSADRWHTSSPLSHMTNPAYA